MEIVKFELSIEKDDRGLYSAVIGCTTSDGTGRASISIMKSDVNDAVKIALAPFLVMSPNLVQDEIDKWYELHPPIESE